MIVFNYPFVNSIPPYLGLGKPVRKCSFVCIPYRVAKRIDKTKRVILGATRRTGRIGVIDGLRQSVQRLGYEKE